MLWAIPTVNGFSTAPANPAAAPRKGMEVPVRESYPRESARGMKIRTNGIPDSAMPKAAPAIEKRVMETGIKNFCRWGFCANV